MVNHSFKSGTHAEIVFYCLQPVHIKNDLYIKLLSTEMSLNRDRWVRLSDTLAVDGFSLIKQLAASGIDHECLETLRPCKNYDVYVLLNSTTQYNALLAETFIGEDGGFRFLEGFSLDSEKSGFNLCFDLSNKLPFIVYRIAIVGDRISALNEGKSVQLKTLYKNMRSTLVVDPTHKNFTVSPWAEKIRSCAVDYAYGAYRKFVKLDKDDLHIPDNSGYIVTFVGNLLDPQGEEESSFRTEFLTHNHSIDRFKEERPLFNALGILNDQPNQEIFLGWQHTTLWNLDRDKSLQLLPLMLHLQNMYFLSHFFYKDFLERIFSEIRYGKHVRRLNGYIVLFDRLVVSFENLFYERERFLNELKPVFRETYDKMEGYWNLGNDYASIQRTISICKESVERKISLFSNKSQNRQSNILFFLAIVQIFSVLSIATDYFSLLGIDVIKEYAREYAFIRSYGLAILTAITLFALLTSYYEKIFNEFAYLLFKINQLLKRQK